ncbi:MAG: hypothetical protein ACXV7J_09300 [Methylomonas sp.]
MKPVYWLLLTLIYLAPVFSLAQESIKPEPAAAKTPAPAPQPSYERPPVASTEEIAVLRAQITEMRRSEDRLLSTVHWTLSAVFAIALGLAAFSWWSSSKLHQQDLQRLKDDLHQQLSVVVDRTLAESARKLEDAQREETTRLHAEMIAFTMWQVGAIRLKIGDISGAMDAAFEQAAAAQLGNSNYVTHAINILAEAFTAASKERYAVTQDMIESAHKLLIQSGDPFGEYGKKLSQAIELYKKSGAA